MCYLGTYMDPMGLCTCMLIQLFVRVRSSQHGGFKVEESSHYLGRVVRV